MSVGVDLPAGAEGGGVEYIGFWPRFGAFVVDSVAVMFLVVPLLVSYFGAAWREAEGVAYQLINWVPPALAVLLFWHFKSSTPGKMVISAVIVDANTFGKPSTGQLIGRYFGYYVSTLGLCLGHLWIAFDPRKQAWHDKMANTVVIRKRA
jgi:uncharacterized RDD family membrane protein YckC